MDYCPKISINWPHATVNRWGLDPNLIGDLSMSIVLCEERGYKVGDKINNITSVGPAFFLRKTKNGELSHRISSQLFKCDCGEFFVSAVSRVKTGHTTSCGCKKIAASKRNFGKRLHHGDSGSPLHNLWHLIKLRCYDRNQDSYPRYGGRNICVFEEWRNSYESFRDYAISHGYRHGLQIDRINNDGNYEPGNIRFVTCSKNCRNKCNTKFVTAFGETKDLATWSEDKRCVVSYYTLWSRIFAKCPEKRWNPESAITTQPLVRGKRDKIPSGCEAIVGDKGIV